MSNETTYIISEGARRREYVRIFSINGKRQSTTHHQTLVGKNWVHNVDLPEEDRRRRSHPAERRRRR